MYEEDFKAEREDRVRAHAQRNEEGERYREEVARLQKQLNSHKGNLSGLENVHLARQKELMQAMEDLRKSQEEVQAKTSQVKQYKKQHDGLVAKVKAFLSCTVKGYHIIIHVHGVYFCELASGQLYRTNEFRDIPMVACIDEHQGIGFHLLYMQHLLKV